MARYSNITIVAPEGTTQQSDDHLVCLPADWSTVLRFFLFNYVAHAFTVWSRPGETASEKVFSAVLAFFLPVSGLGRGIDAIYRGALLGRGLWTNLFGSATNATQVRTAMGKFKVERRAVSQSAPRSEVNFTNAKVSISCQVRASIRSQVQVSLDNNSQTFSDAYQIEVDGDESAIRPPDLSSNRHVNGITSTPERFGYRIMELPRTSENLIVTPKDQEEEGGTEEANGEETAKLHIPQASNVAVALIAVLQIVYAGYGVLTVTGDQFDRFGYSAFHLTVLPYLVMSVVNLVGNLLTPTYPGITLVGTATSDEVHRRAGIVQSTIGYIENLSSFEETTNSADEMGNYTVIVYECSQNMTRYVQDSDYENTPMHYDNSIPHSLQICFDKECRRTHKGILKVPSGRPKPVKHPWAFCCKGPTLFLAVASHIYLYDEYKYHMEVGRKDSHWLCFRTQSRAHHPIKASVRVGYGNWDINTLE
ncbi:predicted protein [Pyrenophora tritici-repentis Pt-1C-BFP]|uniref:Uncharacterized protein n=1 Tax=Pyrenophora tritici-repentis (strain Pt-1C-BFP) TaxID=426418 RepID=B2W221_PYRTR|nr:uncharacterized protein PTRG_03469 [Pyrenophora tritici-repentis Pt-1C-BFP]EDU46307.1 predicted protein [Pyrenophora tritici-repentis Pt-1C-BFP]